MLVVNILDEFLMHRDINRSSIWGLNAEQPVFRLRVHIGDDANLSAVSVGYGEADEVGDGHLFLVGFCCLASLEADIAAHEALALFGCVEVLELHDGHGVGPKSATFNVERHDDTIDPDEQVFALSGVKDVVGEVLERYNRLIAKKKLIAIP